MSGSFKASCEIWVFVVKPLSDGLVRIAPPKSADDLPVVVIAPNGLYYCLLPGTFFPQVSVVCVQSIGIISYLTVVVLEIGVLLSQRLDFLNEVVLMCFGMRLIEAAKVACSTSTANVWSASVTLEKTKQAGKLAFAPIKTYA